ncbi:MAG TPA: shikimate dehydrogenase [Drouetiella sp.]
MQQDSPLYRLALIGHPVSHSMSPPMHNAALKHSGLAGSYDLIDIAPENLERDIAKMVADGYTGFNVTIPHKDAIYRMASGHTNESLAAQASNTVRVHQDGSLLAHNTDIGGFQEALDELITAEHTKMIGCVVGTGGASKAAILAMANLGFPQIAIFSRDAARAEALAGGLRHVIPMTTEFLTTDSWQSLPNEQISVIVNSSPIGQNAMPLPDWIDAWFESLSDHALLMDMVYSKTDQPTPLVDKASEFGLRAADGAEMLIRQAHNAFEFWTTATVPVQVFRDAFYQAKQLRSD